MPPDAGVGARSALKQRDLGRIRQECKDFRGHMTSEVFCLLETSKVLSDDQALADSHSSCSASTARQPVKPLRSCAAARRVGPRQLRAALIARAKPDGFSQAIECPALRTTRTLTPISGSRFVSGSGNEYSPNRTVRGIDNVASASRHEGTLPLISATASRWIAAGSDNDNDMAHMSLPCWRAFCTTA